MNKILKLTLVLFLICAIVAGVLGVVDLITRGPINTYQTEKTDAARAVVLKSEGGYEPVLDEAYTIVVNGQKVKITDIQKAKNGEGYVVTTEFSGAQGTVTMLVGVNNSLQCTGISIIKHSETSGLGANAASTAQVGQDFRAQFVGVTKNVQLKKAGGEIDALSGATITSRSVINATAAAITAVEDLG